MATNLNKYVVVADAIVVTIGKKANGKPEYTRVVRGGTINGTDTSTTIKRFLGLGAIKKVESKEELAAIRNDLKDTSVSAQGRPASRHRLTLRTASRLSGGEDDPVQKPLEDIQPLAAGIPETSPSVLTAKSLGDE